MVYREKFLYRSNMIYNFCTAHYSFSAAKTANFICAQKYIALSNAVFNQFNTLIKVTHSFSGFRLRV